VTTHPTRCPAQRRAHQRRAERGTVTAEVYRHPEEEREDRFLSRLRDFVPMTPDQQELLDDLVAAPDSDLLDAGYRTCHALSKGSVTEGDLFYWAFDEFYEDSVMVKASTSAPKWLCPNWYEL